MKQAYPNYYSQFKCIADRCKHNCCIGWEIDVDEQTLNMYNNLNTPLGDRIRKNIEGDEPHFVLTENERCPFLDENNLCDIIKECGNEGLCEICRLHPRFSNYFSDFVETGLGICCEEAARIVLTMKEKFCIHIPKDVALTQEEREFFEIRNGIFEVLQDRSVSIRDRFEKLCEMFEIDMDYSLNKLCELYESLERLDESWTKELEVLKNYDFDKSIFCDENFSSYFEQLSCYLVFRHLSDAIFCLDYPERINFVLMSCYIVGALWEYYGHKLTLEKLIDIVRMYSAEIEYSEQNTQRLMEDF